MGDYPGYPREPNVITTFLKIELKKSESEKVM